MSSFDRTQQIFAAALELEGEARDAYILEQCGEDEELHADVRSLLTAHDRIGDSDFVEEPLFDLDPGTPAAELIGAEVGPFRIDRVLGEGGMGIVYAAIQESPRRDVALKILRTGISSRERLQRFRYESEILARLRHPGIAHIYEAGVHTIDTRRLPYFAMELVAGARPIDEYAREISGSPASRTRRVLELFVEICTAVHHGHQRGVIHRDLKPGNVLVDDSGRPKVIDFGVARCTDADVAVTTMRTTPGELVGTLQYMSPEQCESDPLKLDTRSDVYSLAAMLYEILCGKPPHDLHGVSVPQALRVIVEQSPARPSSLAPSLRGDLETILLKGLEKNPERRYASSADFAKDLQRYLDGRPIEARPATTLYQLSKFAARNRALVTSLAVLVIVGAVAVAGILWFAIRTEKHRRVVERVRTIFENVLKAPEPRYFGEDATIVDAVDRVRGNLPTMLADEPEVLADVLGTIGEVYGSLGRLDDAHECFAEAIAIHERLGSSALVIWDLRCDLASNDVDRGNTAKATEVLESAVAALEPRGVEERTVLGKAHGHLGKIRRIEGKFEAAEGSLRASDELLKTIDTETTAAVRAKTLNGLAAVVSDQGRHDDAVPIAEEALELARSYGHTLLAATILNTLATVHYRAGRLQDAEETWAEAHEIHVAKLPSDHPILLAVRGNIANMLTMRGEYENAVEIQKELLAATRRQYPDGHPAIASALDKLASNERGAGRHDDAATHFREALGIIKDAYGAENIRVARTLENLAFNELARERFEDAEEPLEEALRIRNASFPEGHHDTARPLILLGTARLKRREPQQAERYLREAVELRRRFLPGHWQTASAESLLGECLLDQGRFDDAKPLLEQSVQILTAKLPATNPRLAEAQARLDRLRDHAH